MEISSVAGTQLDLDVGDIFLESNYRSRFGMLSFQGVGSQYYRASVLIISTPFYLSKNWGTIQPPTPLTIKIGMHLGFLNEAVLDYIEDEISSQRWITFIQMQSHLLAGRRYDEKENSRV